MSALLFQFIGHVWGPSLGHSPFSILEESTLIGNSSLFLSSSQKHSLINFRFHWHSFFKSTHCHTLSNGSLVDFQFHFQIWMSISILSILCLVRILLCIGHNRLLIRFFIEWFFQMVALESQCLQILSDLSIRNLHLLSFQQVFSELLVLLYLNIYLMI